MSLLSSHPLPRRKSSREGPYPDAFPARPTTAPRVDQWSDALLHALENATGTPVAFAEPPAALDHSEGPWAFGCHLTRPVRWPGAEREDNGSDEIALRLAPDRASLEHEAAVMAAVQRQLNGAVRVHAVVQLDDGPEPLWALVRDEVGGVGLPELIGFNLHHSDDLLRGFATRQAEIHGLPVTELVAQGVPVIDTEAEVARLDAGGLSKQRRWLDEHRPAPSEPVLCHGTYQPMSVFGPPPEDWEAYGGVGRGLVTTNWCAAVVAEREFDVAYSLVALWSAPFFAKNRPERTAIKMIRNTLINTYKRGYEDAHPTDPDRVRFWEAFHVLRGIARMEGLYDSAHSPFAPPDRGVLPSELATELPRRFVQLTRVR
ncbi:MAG TPA: hypothetical protein VHS57_08555 [Acidimicrobiales bacterium]|nr:hypothetical protein [Acidimicrobiales bacterium]